MIDKSKITYIGDNRYIIVRVITEETMQGSIDEWKSYLNADKAFRKDSSIYFCRTIEDATVIDDENSKTNS